MGEIQEYKCPCCNASLSFNAEKQDLHCDSCGADFSVDSLKQMEEAEAGETTSAKYDWEQYEPRSFEENEAVDLSNYQCPSCGAAITGDDTLGATVCPYCGNATIVKKQFEGGLKPDLVVPFEMEKKQAVEAFERACMEAPFLPDEWKDKKRIEEMSGIYVPFWLYDCDCQADIRYGATRTTAWSDANYNYTKTNHYTLFRSGTVGFEHLPVDGSQKADDAFMDSLEPFDFSKAVDFNTAYLSGYLADKYDVDAKESEPRANERVKRSTEDVFRSTTDGYQTVHPKESTVHFSGGKVRYALLPVWMLHIQYNGISYPYAINGQTGKVVGDYPIDQKKKRRYFLKVLGISFAVCLAAGAGLGKLLGYL